MPTPGSSEYLTPEAQARMRIDEQLAACGWQVQDYRSAAVAAAEGVAVREVPTASGPADYVLYIDGQAVGVIEAKKAGSTLTGVEFQTRKYQSAYPDELPAFEVDGALPFGYESTGSETRFTSALDPVSASRRVFSFHRPETPARWREDFINGSGAGLRAGLQLLPDLASEAQSIVAGAGRSDSQAGAVFEGEPSSDPDSDGHGFGQDFHSGECVLSPVEALRCFAGSLSC